MVDLGALKTHATAITLASLAVSGLLLFSIQQVIMAGPYDCSKYDQKTNQVSGCDKNFGGERSATGKVWNISKLEQCVIDGLRDTRPQWECCSTLREKYEAADTEEKKRLLIRKLKDHRSPKMQGGFDYS